MDRNFIAFLFGLSNKDTFLERLMTSDKKWIVQKRRKKTEIETNK